MSPLSGSHFSFDFFGFLHQSILHIPASQQIPSVSLIGGGYVDSRVVSNLKERSDGTGLLRPRAPPALQSVSEEISS